MSKKYKDEQITKEEYDDWRYNYPKFDDSKMWVKVQPQEISDFIVKALTEDK